MIHPLRPVLFSFLPLFSCMCFPFPFARPRQLIKVLSAALRLAPHSMAFHAAMVQTQYQKPSDRTSSCRATGPSAFFCGLPTELAWPAEFCGIVESWAPQTHVQMHVRACETIRLAWHSHFFRGGLPLCDCLALAALFGRTKVERDLHWRLHRPVGFPLVLLL